MPAEFTILFWMATAESAAMEVNMKRVHSCHVIIRRVEHQGFQGKLAARNEDFENMIITFSTVDSKERAKYNAQRSKYAFNREEPPERT